MHQRKFNFCQSNVIEMDIVWNAPRTNGSNWSISSRESGRGRIRRSAVNTHETQPKQNRKHWTRASDGTSFPAISWSGHAEAQSRITQTQNTEFQKETATVSSRSNPRMPVSVVLSCHTLICLDTLIGTDLGPGGLVNNRSMSKSNRFRISYIL